MLSSLVAEKNNRLKPFNSFKINTAFSQLLASKRVNSLGGIRLKKDFS